MLLNFTDGQPFATGAAECDFRLATASDKYHRLMVAVSIEGITADAVIDTGAAFFVCSSQVAKQIALNPTDGIQERINIRGTVVPGSLHRLNLILLATDDGGSLDVEVTAFIPNPEMEQSWDLPSFLGMTGCLERLRFAIDTPINDYESPTFYFGPHP